MLLNWYCKRSMQSHCWALIIKTGKNNAQIMKLIIKPLQIQNGVDLLQIFSPKLLFFFLSFLKVLAYFLFRSLSSSEIMEIILETWSIHSIYRWAYKNSKYTHFKKPTLCFSVGFYNKRKDIIDPFSVTLSIRYWN